MRIRTFSAMVAAFAMASMGSKGKLIYRADALPRGNDFDPDAIRKARKRNIKRSSSI